MEQAAADLDGLFCWMKVDAQDTTGYWHLFKGDKYDVCEGKTEREDDKRERDTAAMLLFRGGKRPSVYICTFDLTGDNLRHQNEMPILF